MSAQGDIATYLQSLSPESGKDFIPITAEQVAQKTGVSRDKVNKTFYNLMTRGRIELVRGPNGRSIIGYRNTEPPPRGQRQAAKPDIGRVRQAEPVQLHAGQQRPRGLATPMLDEYQSAKDLFNKTAERLGDLMQGEFRANPYAEEGIRLRSRLETIEPQYSEMARELEAARRDLRALRRNHQADMMEDALKRGAVAQTGD